MSAKKLSKGDEYAVFRHRRETHDSWAVIAKLFNTSVRTVYEGYHRVLKAEQPSPDEVREAVAEEIDKLDVRESRANASYIRLAKSASRADSQVDPLDIQRLDGVLDRVAKRRAALLGYDAPKRIEIEGLSTDPLTIEIEKASIAIAALEASDEGEDGAG